MPIYIPRCDGGPGTRVDRAETRREGRGLRVTGGRLGGRRLRVPRGGLRPTSDRIREAVFGRLENLEGAAVLDLYAGTGALGIEAISRGASSAVFVERAARCLSVLRDNVSALGLDDAVQIVSGDAPRAVRRLGKAGERFDLVLVDPPYASAEAPRALEALVAAGVLARGATVVVERGRCHPLPVVRGLALLDERRYGDTVITRLAAVGEDQPTGRSSDATDEEGG